jgi:RNA polymerase sigma factor (sigma-70 family)
MARQTAALIRSVLSAAADAKHTDRELLRQYAVDGDQAAFATLVRRHTAMVIGVCQRVLRCPTEAEDACQAVFLVLAKKANSTGWQESVANWLYTTARKVALNARVASSRRAKREGGAAVPESVSPTDAMTGRELVEALDEELARLSPRYREPLVLCHLEGLTRDEAAVRLGVPVATLKSHLERGRKKLADALTARRCALGIGLLATFATSPSLASSPRLLGSILAAVDGAPSASVAALAKGVVVNGLLIRTKLALLSLVGVAVLGFGYGSVRSAAEPQKPVAKKMEKPAGRPDPKSAEPKPDAKERTISGQVLGAEGRPVVAELSLVWLNGKTESLGKTKPDGTFAVTVPLKSPGAYLVAKAAGHGVEFMMPATNTPSEVTFRLPKDNPIRGRVIDTQGKPVAGASVAVRSLMTYEKRPAERYLSQWTKELRAHGIPLPSGDRTLWFHENGPADRASNSPFAVKTDKDGKFELTGVGAERLAGLTISGGGVADTQIGVMNRARFDPKPFNEDQNDKEMMRHTFVSMAHKLYGPEPVVILEQEKILRGRVTDHLGEPRVGVRVTFSRPNKRDLNPNYNAATTDKDGRYEIRGARKYKGYMVECGGDSKVGLLPCQAFADDTVGYEPVTLDLKCAKGVVVTGTVKDKATGKPVSAILSVAVLANNPFVKDYPPFMHSASGWSDQNRTDKDGRFRVVTIAGQVLLMAQPNPDNGVDFQQSYKPVKADSKYPDYFHTRFGGLGYYGLDSSYGIVQGCWCKVIDAKKGDAEVAVDIELERSTSMTVRVIDAEGKPVKGAHATGITHTDYENARPHPDSDALTVFNVEPGKERLVAVAHAKRKLVGTLAVKASDKEPVVELGPGGVVSGRVVGEDGKPISGVTVDLHYARREVKEVSHVLDGEEERMGRSQPRQVVTGADGEFRLGTLFPGQEFRLTFQKGKKRYDPDYQKAPKYTVAKHGDERKLGDVTVTPRRGTEE